MMPSVNALRRPALVLVLLLAGWQLWGAVWIHTKAALAQYLLVRAWDSAQREGEAQKPWPWADTWPVARLQLPTLEADYRVLAGTSVPGCAGPSSPGTAIRISGSCSRCSPAWRFGWKIWRGRFACFR